MQALNRAHFVGMNVFGYNRRATSHYVILPKAVPGTYQAITGQPTPANQNLS